MVWALGNNTAICTPHNPSQSPCTCSMLSLLTLLSSQLNGTWDRPQSSDERKELHVVDFIVVGAGAAGCVVANRLSENSNWEVLLLERGSEEPIISEAPALQPILLDSSIDYAYTTQSESRVCANQPHHACPVPRGKVMGGCSSINTMMWVRGNKWDYDQWQALGNPGWSWNDVLPYFVKAEDFRIPKSIKRYPSLHGIGGYQTIEHESYDENLNVIFDGWKELGLKEVDYNSGNNIGFSRIQYARKNGNRQSSNGAYIRPIREKRKNLHVRPNIWVTKVIIDPKTKGAIGVEYRSEKSSVTKKVFAKKEVILSAGAIDSPKLLMLSGIGAADNLRESGVKMIHNLPAVGKNLQNHYFVPTSMRVDINNETKPFNFPKALRKDTIAWLRGQRNTSISKSFAMDAMVFLKTSLEDVPSTVPDVQVTMSKFKRDGSNIVEGTWPYYDGFDLLAMNLNPKSRGMLKLDSKDPLNNQPLIFGNYLSDPRDTAFIPEASRVINRILDTQSFKKSGYAVSKLIPPECAHLKFESPAYYECISVNYATFIFHIVGTCKMGPKSDRTSVVDSRLRVHGIERLRVIDASIMPLIIRGNTNAPTVMIAERASDFVKEDWINHE